MRKLSVLSFPLLLLLLGGCASSSRPQGADEWRQLEAEYDWIQTVRAAGRQVPDDATRREQIEILLENHRRLEPMLAPFLDRLASYALRTGDERAAQIYADEKIRMGDVYIDVLSRHDKAIEVYRSALQLDPENPVILQRIAQARDGMYADSETFNRIQSGMSEEDVRDLLGLPREDWIKQTVREGKVFSVWIYPKEDGGAAAVYFDQGVVYHVNWSAAAATGGASPKGEGAR